MDKDNLIYPEPVVIGADETESWENWGFRDTSFAINERDVVEITGTRYELSGKELPRLLPWIRETLAIDLDAKDPHTNAYPTEIPPPVESPKFTDAIRQFLGENQIDTDGENRLRHGHGHTQEEMFAIKHKSLAVFRTWSFIRRVRNRLLRSLLRQKSMTLFYYHLAAERM